VPALALGRLAGRLRGSGAVDRGGGRRGRRRDGALRRGHRGTPRRRPLPARGAGRGPRRQPSAVTRFVW
jgi:hypothetical protein